MDRSDARLRYAKHRANAKKRGIEFDLSFDEWWEIWEPRFSERGTRSDQLGMCRTRDQGPYRYGNVRLDTPKGNAGDRMLMRRRPWMSGDDSEILEGGFKSYGSRFPKPEVALEIERGEREAEHYE